MISRVHNPNSYAGIEILQVKLHLFSSRVWLLVKNKQTKEKPTKQTKKTNKNPHNSPGKADEPVMSYLHLGERKDPNIF